jgi:hypothetical protein
MTVDLHTGNAVAFSDRVQGLSRQQDVVLQISLATIRLSLPIKPSNPPILPVSLYLDGSHAIGGIVEGPETLDDEVV